MKVKSEALRKPPHRPTKRKDKINERLDQHSSRDRPRASRGVNSKVLMKQVETKRKTVSDQKTGKGRTNW